MCKEPGKAGVQLCLTHSGRMVQRFSLRRQDSKVSSKTTVFNHLCLSVCVKAFFLIIIFMFMIN